MGDLTALEIRDKTLMSGDITFQAKFNDQKKDRKNIVIVYNVRARYIYWTDFPLMFCVLSTLTKALLY